MQATVENKNGHGSHQEDSTPSSTSALARTVEQRRAVELAELAPRDRALLTPEVVERWTRDLHDNDWTLADVVILERRRQIALRTLRQTEGLTDLEFRLVRYLQKSEGRTRTYLQIAHHLWGTADHPVTASLLRSHHGYAAPMVSAIQVLVHQIRRKLEIDPLRPQHIATIRGVGYRWYSSPPAFDDGEDYTKRAQESLLLREQVARELGVVEDDRIAALPEYWEPGAPVLGPEHPAAFEGRVIEGRATVVNGHGDRAPGQHRARPASEEPVDE